MEPRSALVGDPDGNQIAGMGQVAKQGFVQKLVSHPAFEVFDEAILHRLARRDVLPLDLDLGKPV